MLYVASLTMTFFVLLILVLGNIDTVSGKKFRLQPGVPNADLVAEMLMTLAVLDKVADDYTTCIVYCHNSPVCLSVLYSEDHNCTGWTTIFSNISSDFTSGYASKTYYYTQYDPVPCEGNGYEGIPEIKTCIKLHTDVQIRSVAKHTCELEGGRLIRLDSMKKIEAVRQFSNNWDIIFFYTEGNRFDDPAQFKWSNDKPIDFWAYYEPQWDIQFCVVASVFEALRLHDCPCDLPGPFLCEKALADESTSG